MDAFSLLESIANLLTNIPEALQKQQDRALRRKFGNNLMMCYLNLLEVINRGYAIVGELEYFVRRYSQHIEQQDDWTYLGGKLRRAVAEQATNLSRLNLNLGLIERELKILHPELARQLQPLLQSKFGSLENLANIFRSGALPTKIEFANHELISTEEIKMKREWDKVVYERVKLYLEHAKPKERLKSLSACTNMIRETLIKNFSLEEILSSIDQSKDSS